MTQEKPEKLLRQGEVAKMIGVSKSTVWNLVRDGTLPTPLKFGPRMSRWRLSEIEAAIEQAEARGRAA